MKDRTRAGRRIGNLRTAKPAAVAPWYRVQNFVDRPNSAAIYIYDVIGCQCWYDDTCQCMSANNLVQDLAGLKVEDLHIHINSPGGEVDDGVAIYNAIKRHPANVTVHIDGLAASAASFIAMAGDTVLVARNAQVMIHDALMFVFGNEAEVRKSADLLGRYSDNIADIYAQKSGGTVESWRALMREEVWYTGAEAVDAGLADAVDGAPTETEEMVAAKWDLSVFGFRRAGAGPAAGVAAVVEPVVATAPTAVEPERVAEQPPAAVVEPEAPAGPTPEPVAPAPPVDAWTQLTQTLRQSAPPAAAPTVDDLLKALKEGPK